MSKKNIFQLTAIAGVLIGGCVFLFVIWDLGSHR